MAVRFITLDAYTERVEFYKRFGFLVNQDKRYTKKDHHVSMRYDLFNELQKP